MDTKKAHISEKGENILKFRTRIYYHWMKLSTQKWLRVYQETNTEVSNSTSKIRDPRIQTEIISMKLGSISMDDSVPSQS